MVNYPKILDALQFYANKENYVSGYKGYGEDNDTRSLAAKDCGEKAREAISGITSAQEPTCEVSDGGNLIETMPENG